MNLIGVTGGLGSGKTTVASYFKGLGARVIDADRVGKKLLLDKDIRKGLVLIFGKKILKNSKIDRNVLAGIVFKDKKKLAALSRVMHPHIIGEIRSFASGSSRGITVIDAPLLIESGLYKEMDTVILVVAGRKERIARCLKKGVSAPRAARRISFQMRDAEKKKYADFVIVNNGSKKTLKKEVVKLWKKIKV